MRTAVFLGGSVLAIGIVGSVVLFEHQKPVQINLNRDICVSSVSDKLSTGDIIWKLTPSPRTESVQLQWDDSKKEFWTAIKALISSHNAIVKDFNDSTEYVFGGAISFPTDLPYRGLATGVVCRVNDLNVCRNRNFWFFRPIPPQQLADIVFRNTVTKKTSIKACPF